MKHGFVFGALALQIAENTQWFIDFIWSHNNIEHNSYYINLRHCD